MKKLSNKHSGLSESVTLAISAEAKKLKNAGKDVIFFSIGEPDFNTPQHIKNAAIEAIDNKKIGYTDASGMPELKDAVIDKLKRDNNICYERNNIIISNGAKHALFNALQAICNPWDEVIIISPYWVSYPELVKMAGGVPVVVETEKGEGYRLSKEKLHSAITDKTKAIIINSPNNPTGRVLTLKELEEIGRAAIENDLYVIRDEIYEKLIYEGTHISIASINGELKDRTIVINGLSKSHAMTGWRIGYLATNKDIANMIVKIQSHATSNPNTLAQYAAICALNDDSKFLTDVKEEYLVRRDLMIGKIKELIGLQCFVPKGAFYVLMPVKDFLNTEIEGTVIKDSVDFSRLLMDKKRVVVIPGEAFACPEFVRLSFATSQKNIIEGIERIKELILSMTA